MLFGVETAYLTNREGSGVSEMGFSSNSSILATSYN